MLWGRPSVIDLWHDLRTVTSEIHSDWDLSTPGLREAWNSGDLSRFHGWNKQVSMEDASIVRNKQHCHQLRSTAASNSLGGESWQRRQRRTNSISEMDFRFVIFAMASMISGRAYGEELVLSRRGDEFFAIGAHCTHYGGTLEEGLIVGDTEDPRNEASGN
jgi:hypothetical protein